LLQLFGYKITLTVYNPLDYTHGYANDSGLPEFQKKSIKLLSDSEKLSVINYLATHPASGDIMQGTGGIRKLRWSAQGKGKSGGVRVIYYHHNKTMPLFLLTLFGKGEKANLTKAECQQLSKFTSSIIKNYGSLK